jgi:hypothetical protein
VFLSPHKFIGGPGTPGSWSPSAACSRNSVPATPGGGTVAYVNPDEHRYLADPEHREEGGTPAIIESIRAGLVFQLKEAVGAADHPGPRGGRSSGGRSRRGRATPTSGHPRQPRARRLSIVSFVVRHGEAYLHWNFVVALLNDLLRDPGPRRLLVRWALRPPPARHRLGTSTASNARDRPRREGMKPGWVRVNFNYFLSEAQFEFLADRGRRRAGGPGARDLATAVVPAAVAPRLGGEGGGGGDRGRGGDRDRDGGRGGDRDGGRGGDRGGDRDGDRDRGRGRLVADAERQVRADRAVGGAVDVGDLSAGRDR